MGAGFFSGTSVIRVIAVMLAAFSTALRVTLAGSMICGSAKRPPDSGLYPLL